MPLVIELLHKFRGTNQIETIADVALLTMQAHTSTPGLLLSTGGDRIINLPHRIENLSPRSTFHHLPFQMKTPRPKEFVSSLKPCCWYLEEKECSVQAPGTTLGISSWEGLSWNTVTWWLLTVLYGGWRPPAQHMPWLFMIPHTQHLTLLLSTCHTHLTWLTLLFSGTFPCIQKPPL